jgi:hypothetical protein
VDYEKRKMKRKANRLVHGVTSRGTLEKKTVWKMGPWSSDASSPFPFEANSLTKIPDPRLSFIPICEVKHSVMPREIIQRLKIIESRILEVRICGGGRTCPRKQSIGVSAGNTIVTGGTYSSRNNGIAGSIHRNSNFENKTLYTMTETDENDRLLQREIKEVISMILLAAFGDSIWFKALMVKLCNIPKEPFIPHLVHNSNNIGAAFVFCANPVPGGELVVGMPGGYRKIKLEEGTVVGGSWSQHAHCTEVDQGSLPRHTFVVYLDWRSLLSSYKFIK